MTERNEKKRHHWIAPALTVAALLVAGVAGAQPRGERFGPPGGPPGAGLLSGPMAERLGLTDEQRDAVRSILEAQREATAPWHEDLKSLGAELERAIEAEPFDEEAVRALARQAADVRVELAVSRARTAQEIRTVLTPAQRETLGEMRAQREERRGAFGGPPGRGFHRRGPGG